MSLCDTNSGAAARGIMRKIKLQKKFTSKVTGPKAEQLKVVSGRWSVVSILSGVLFVLLTAHCSLFTVQAQTGGTFDLSHSVIASGGGSNSTSGTFNVSGTAGQPVAGTGSAGAQYNLRGGFWFQNLTPTAASVSISGQVATFNGSGIRNVRVALTAPNGSIRTTFTSSFGYYAFDDVEVGQTYILEVTSRRFSFPEPTRIVVLLEDLKGADFKAFPL